MRGIQPLLIAQESGRTQCMHEMIEVWALASLSDLGKAVRIRSQRHHMIKNCHLRDFWLEKISKPSGASAIRTKSKFYLQQNVDNINT